MIKQFIIFIIIGIIITLKRTNTNSFVNFALNLFDTKIKVKGIKNLLNYNNKRIVIMSNHLNGIDYGIIVYALSYYTHNKKKIYAIAKHNVFGDKTDANIVGNTLGLIKNDMFKLLNLIPYNRGDKASGEFTKKIMLEKIDEGDTILLFPEGTTSKTRFPSKFKPGSFHLCAENNIEILPITIKFDKNIALDTKDPVKICDWFNLNSTLYIHKPIYHENWEILMNSVYDKICEPLNKKMKDKN